MDEQLKVFVYGTLKVSGRFAEQFDEARLSSIEARLYGYRMFTSRLLKFPWIVPVPGIDNVVYGELHTLDPEAIIKTVFDRDRKVLEKLDIIECHTPGSKHNMYERKIVDVFCEHGEYHQAWCYYKPLLGHGSIGWPIESGIWEN